MAIERMSDRVVGKIEEGCDGMCSLSTQCSHLHSFS